MSESFPLIKWFPLSLTIDCATLMKINAMKLRPKAIVVLAGMAFAILIVAGLPIFTHYRAKAKLARYKANLQAAGQKLKPAELTPRLTSQEIAAGPRLIAAASRLRSSAGYGNVPPIMRFAGPGIAVVSWKQSIMPNDES